MLVMRRVQVTLAWLRGARRCERFGLTEIVLLELDWSVQPASKVARPEGGVEVSHGRCAVRQGGRMPRRQLHEAARLGMAASTAVLSVAVWGALTAGEAFLHAQRADAGRRVAVAGRWGGSRGKVGQGAVVSVAIGAGLPQGGTARLDTHSPMWRL